MTEGKKKRRGRKKKRRKEEREGNWGDNAVVGSCGNIHKK